MEDGPKPEHDLTTEEWMRRHLEALNRAGHVGSIYDVLDENQQRIEEASIGPGPHADDDEP